MKFKTLKTAIVSLVMTITCFIGSANAGIITHSGYTHDTTTDIITGGGLEWLQWDKTRGFTIALALGGIANTYLGGGWTLATNAQMASLFNGFGFGTGSTFSAQENSRYSARSPYSFGTGANDAEHNFNLMFGTSRGGNHRDSIVNGVETDGLTVTSAIFGDDADADGLYNVANVQDDWVHQSRGSRDGYVSFSPDNNFTQFFNGPVHGIALVRSAVNVPEPSTLAIFALGMMGLAVRRFKKQA